MAEYVRPARCLPISHTSSSSEWRRRRGVRSTAVASPSSRAAAAVRAIGCRAWRRLVPARGASARRPVADGHLLGASGAAKERYGVNTIRPRHRRRARRGALRVARLGFECRTAPIEAASSSVDVHREPRRVARERYRARGSAVALDVLADVDRAGRLTAPTTSSSSGPPSLVSPSRCRSRGKDESVAVISMVAVVARPSQAEVRDAVFRPGPRPPLRGRPRGRK